MFCKAGLIVAAAMFGMSAAGANSATVTVDAVKQRYPWNGLVDIDYTIASDGVIPSQTTDRLRITVVDRSTTPESVYEAHKFNQAPLPIGLGKHRITWDANGDGVNFVSSDVVVKMTISRYVSRYMVIDVSEGKDATAYPVSFLDGEPSGGFAANDEYKGDKIVLRLIPPGSFVMGSPENELGRNPNGVNETQHPVVLTKGFYMGIFEVTQRQYENVVGTAPTDADHPYRPVSRLSYKTIRGTANWPVDESVLESSFMGLLRAKARVDGASPFDFDLPTEAQWEYACRAGTLGLFPVDEIATTENQANDQAMRFARYKMTLTDGKGGMNNTDTTVGSYDPNPWGLYDMHGNLWEWCRDWYQDVLPSYNLWLDPKGPSSGSDRVARGGAYPDSCSWCRSAFRFHYNPDSDGNQYAGFRISATQQ